MPIYGHTFFSHNCHFLTNQAEILYGYSRDHYLSITHLKLRQGHFLKNAPILGGKMGVATTAAPYGFWATNPTKTLAHWVYLLGQPLSRNRVFQNFSGEPPPHPPPPPPWNPQRFSELKLLALTKGTIHAMIIQYQYMEDFK